MGRCSSRARSDDPDQTQRRSAVGRADVRQALGPGFPKHPLHKIVCIGALIGGRGVEGWRTEAVIADGAYTIWQDEGSMRICGSILFRVSDDVTEEDVSDGEHRPARAGR